MSTLLVTGGAGFVGSALVRQLVGETDATIVNVDALTYAGDLDSLAGARRHPRHVFERVDIRERTEVERLFREHRPDAVLHLAAETHVDRSIDAPTAFVETNVLGTCNLLEAARAYLRGLTGSARGAFRFLHVSTDEVYGDLAPGEPAFDEHRAYAPSSPYSATKAAADHLVRAWHRTYGMPGRTYAIGGTHAELVQFVTDRPGHDRRYATDDTRLRTELDWSPSERFDAGLERTVRWYVDHPEWVQRARSDEGSSTGTRRRSPGP